MQEREVWRAPNCWGGRRHISHNNPEEPDLALRSSKFALPYTRARVAEPRTSRQPERGQIPPPRHRLHHLTREPNDPRPRGYADCTRGSRAQRGGVDRHRFPGVWHILGRLLHQGCLPRDTRGTRGHVHSHLAGEDKPNPSYVPKVPSKAVTRKTSTKSLADTDEAS